MADDADRATDIAERERESCIRRARCESVRRHGPYVCMSCGELNDRRIEGYGTCWDCWTEVSDGGSGGKL